MKMNKIRYQSGKLIIYELMVLLLMGCQQKDTWTRKADMPTARFGPSTCVIKGKIYAIGGAAGYNVSSTIEVYHPGTDTWTSQTGMPEPRVASCCALNGKIYVIGGALTVRPPHPAVSTVEVFNP